MITRKRIFILVSVPLALVAIASALTWWKQDEIKQLAVKQLNNFLKVPVEVGEMDFSLLRAFPSASIDFVDVKCKGSAVEGFKEDLLRASRIRLVFGWGDVFSGNLRFRRLEFNDAFFNVYVGRDGSTNYDVFKDDEGGGEAMQFELSDVRIENTGFTFIDRGNRTDMAFQLQSLRARGLFSEQQFELSTEGGLQVEHLRWKDVDYLPNKHVDLKVVVMVDKAKDVIEIKEGELTLEKLVLHAQGRVGPPGDPARYDFKLSASDADLKGLLALIPGTISSRLSGFSCSGKVYFDLGLKGNTTDGVGLSVRFGADKASIRPKNSPHALESVRFSGTFSNRLSRKNPVEDLQVNGFEALLDGQRLTGAFRLTDFANPIVELRANASLRLDVLGQFYQPDTIENMQGGIVADLSLKGRARDQATWVSSGSLQLENGSFRLRGSSVQYEALSGRVDFAKSGIQVSGFSGRADGSDFRLDGTLKNVFAYLLTKDVKIGGDLKLTSRNLDLDELFRDKSVAPTSEEPYRFSLPGQTNVRMQVEVGLLSFRKFQAWQMSGTITLDDKVLSGRDIAFKAFEGHLVLQGRMDATSDDSLYVVCDVQVKGINVTEMFSQLGNFGQEVMTDRNVKGSLTADVDFACAWNKELVCDFNKLYAVSQIRIENGELNRFEPLLVLSKYLKGSDLNNVKFATLENTIEIRKRAIHIPAMEIRSSALDLTAAGTHSFDNQVDYAFEVSLSQLLSRKVRERNTEFGTIEDDGRGRLKLFLTMKGPMENPRVQYNRKGVEKKIVEEVKKEKVVFKDLLRQEFGWLKKDSSAIEPRNKNEPFDELEIDTDGD